MIVTTVVLTNAAQAKSFHSQCRSRMYAVTHQILNLNCVLSQMAINGTCEAIPTRPQNSYPISARGLEGFNKKISSPPPVLPQKNINLCRRGVGVFDAPTGGGACEGLLCQTHHPRITRTRKLLRTAGMPLQDRSRGAGLAPRPKPRSRSDRSRGAGALRNKDLLPAISRRSWTTER